jgi:asparagine N-glycosylation enzyme membrane subunit Stt3
MATTNAQTQSVGTRIRSQHSDSVRSRSHDMNESRAASRFLRFATPLGLLALAIAVRILAWREVLTDGRILPVGNDAYYHLRRIAYSTFRFPEFLEFDPYINFPFGAKSIWSPLFDWVVALSLRPFVRPIGQGGLEDLERFAMWVPPLLGAATVVAAYFLTKRFFGYGAALVAGVSLSLLSGHVWYSQLGFLDHHAAVALSTTGLLAACMALLSADARGLRIRARLHAVLLGGAIALALLVWPGCLIHVAIAEAGLGLHLLLRTDRSAAKRFAGRLSLAHSVAFAGVAPFALGNHWPQWGEFSPLVLTSFQPWMLGGIAFGTAACAGLWTWPRFGTDRLRRAVSFGAVVCLVLAASGLLMPGLLTGARDAWTWLAREEPFQALVSESLPLLWTGESVSWKVALVRLSLFFPLFPLALVALARSLRGAEERSALWLLLGWSAALCILTLLQRRFFNSFSVSLAVVLGACAPLAYRWIASMGSPVPRRRTARAVTGAGLALLLVPTMLPYLRHVKNEWAVRTGERLVVTPSFGAMSAGVETAAWLAEVSPPTAGWIDPTRRPAYGVLAPWHLGHVIEYVGHRPTVVDNFGDDLGGDNFAWAQAYWYATEPEVEQQLDARRLRYVISQRNHHFLGEKPPVGSLFHSLAFVDGSRLVPPADAPDLSVVPALERHRLVFESHGVNLRERKAPAVYKIYEVVPGAIVVGRAAPGATIEVSIPLKTNRNRAFEYRTEIRADDEGRYRVRLPYANRGGPKSVRATKPYRFSCGDKSRFLSVKERSVQRGRTLRGPRLCVERS